VRIRVPVFGSVDNPYLVSVRITSRHVGGRMTTPRPGRFARLAGWSQRHHWWALALWLVALVVVSGASVTVGDDYRDDHTLPGSESQAVSDALADQDPTQSADTIQIVVQADDLTGQSVRPRVASMLDDVADLSPVEQ